MADTDLRNCPACGSDLRDYAPEDAERHEWWQFFCGAEVVRENGKFSDADHCHDALPNALRRLNEKPLNTD